MSAFKCDLTNSGVVCAGVRGVQNMRRSRSTSALGKTQSKVRTAREYLGKHGCETNAIGTMLFKSTVGSLGLDLMLAPLSGNGKTNVQVVQKLAAKDDNVKLSRLKVQAPSQREAGKPKVEKAQSWAPVTAFPGHVESTSGAWRSFCKDIHSYEEVFVMSSGDMERDSSKHVASTCRRYYSSTIQFYEELYLLVGSDGALLDDEHTAAIRSNENSSVGGLRRFFFCREIHAYEEFYNIVGEDSIAFDDVFVDALGAAGADENMDGKFLHFYGKPIQSYDEFFNLVGTDEVAFDEDVETTAVSSCDRHRFYCKEISSYEELYNLVATTGELLDEDHLADTETEALKTCHQRYFYCRCIESYEDLYAIAGESSGVFDDELSN